LQSADFARFALLLRLRDSSLQTTHVTIGWLPVDGMPDNRTPPSRQRRC
jgi:hypothetical protein